MWLDECIIEEMDFLISVYDKENLIKLEVFGAAPVRATGEIDGKALSFQARHSDWHFEVAGAGAGTGTNVGDGPPLEEQADDEAFVRMGKVKDASFMLLSEALKLIDGCLAEYLQLCNEKI